MAGDRHHQVGREEIVTVVGVTEYGSVMVTDRLGASHEVPVGWRAKGTSPPAEGELWTLKREGGAWRMGELISDPVAVVVTGSRSADPDLVLAQVLAVMEASGLIDDQTTA